MLKRSPFTDRLTAFYRRLAAGRGQSESARLCFETVSARARDPALYEAVGVPDTIDGRFDAVVLVLIAVLRRLKREGEAGRDFAQRVFDAAFRSFDDGLREMGIGDLSVGRKIRDMSEAFYGRAAAYDAALEGGDGAALEAAILRNVFRGAPADIAAPTRLARLLEAFAAGLDETSFEDLVAARLPTFAPETP